MVDAIDSKSILGCQGAGSSPVIGKLFLLDFDGLLVDTERLHQLAYKEALGNWGFSFDIDFLTYSGLAHHISGTALRDYAYNLFPTLLGKWTELRNDKLIIYSRLIKEHVDLMPFVPEFLTHLQNNQIPCAVVTNSPKKDVEIIKQHAPILNTISHWITREDYEKPKPAPDSWLKGLSLFPHINPHETIGLEDTLKGVVALKLARINPILICSPNHPQVKESIDIPHFADLISALNSRYWL